jgi:hypothetical protein
MISKLWSPHNDGMKRLFSGPEFPEILTLADASSLLVNRLVDVAALRLEVTSNDCRLSLAATEPPAGLTNALAALCWDANGSWKLAHESAK